MLKDIVFVEPLEGFRLHIRFDDGIEGIVEVTKLVPLRGVFESLKDAAEFVKVRVNVDLGTVEWECGADLDPDVLYAVITGQPIPDYQSLITANQIVTL